MDEEDEGRGRICVDHLLNELRNLYTRFQQEYDITTVEFIGALEAMKHWTWLAVEDDGRGDVDG